MTIHELASKKPYGTLESAKAAAFRAIESGDLVEYLIGKNICFKMPPGKRQRRKQEKMINFGSTLK